jgi:proteic killer suppression protein
MIESFRHKGLKRLFESGDRSKIRPDLAEKVERILARLDAAGSAEDMNVAGFGLHPLTGDLKGYWAIVVSRNWRVIFRFDDGSAFDVDFLDYH